MGLFDDEDFEIEDDENIYLKEPEKGIQLVSKILSNPNVSNNKNRNIKKLDKLLSKKIFESMKKIKLNNEVEYYYRLKKLSNKLEEQNKIRLLKNRSVIGFGGKFSAGKSKFINSLINDDILPEDQNPTTSIPTYIVTSSEEAIRAHTFNGKNVELDPVSVQALTHAFYKKYKLGFSKFINNLVIETKNLNSKNIALLDTPGYSKYDVVSKKNISDEQNAYDQLKSVDFLIWLVDIENGIIQAKDIEFIKSLDVGENILFVFNKADKKSQKDIEDIVEKSEEILNDLGIEYFGVTAYSSYKRKEYLSKDLINQFIKKAESFNNRKDDLYNEFIKIENEIFEQISTLKSNKIQERNKLGNIIFTSNDIMEIKTLTEIYSEIKDEIAEIYEAEKNLKSICYSIKDSVSAI